MMHSHLRPDDISNPKTQESHVCSSRHDDRAVHACSAPEPRISWQRSPEPAFARFVWLILLVGSAAALATAWHITPDPRGHGAHEQLGLSPCGFYLTTGYPCPTCGATTAFAWVVHGHPLKGLATHPFGALLAFAAIALLGVSLVGIVTAGVPAMCLSRRLSFGLALIIMALILGSWLYKLMVMTAAR